MNANLLNGNKLEMVMTEVGKHGKLLACRDFSSHNLDDYLAVVLVKRESDYVTWSVNFSSGKASLNLGHYGHSLESGIEDYNSRTNHFAPTNYNLFLYKDRLYHVNKRGSN